MTQITLPLSSTPPPQDGYVSQRTKYVFFTFCGPACGALLTGETLLLPGLGNNYSKTSLSICKPTTFLAPKLQEAAFLCPKTPGPGTSQRV